MAYLILGLSIATGLFINEDGLIWLIAGVGIISCLATTILSLL